MITLGIDKTFGDLISLVRATSMDLVVIVDSIGRAAGIIRDAEIRRLLLGGEALDTPVSRLMDSSPDRFAPHEDSRDSNSYDLVILDAEGRPLEFKSTTTREPLVDTAIIMAGGEGKRLRPLTADTPKPMLPIAGTPILEHIVRRLVREGVQQIVISLGYRGDQIVAHFGSGEQFGVRITYIHEDRPLGTAGAIGFVHLSTERPLLVMNGDILSEFSLRHMAEFHVKSAAAMTLGARAWQQRIPYGVLRLVDQRIVAVDEKPLLSEWTNAGIYLMKPALVAKIPRNTYLDMTVMIERLIRQGEPVTAFGLFEYWCDIGRIEDYEDANRRYSSPDL